MYLKTTHYKQFDAFELKESSFKVFSLPDHFHDTFCISFIEHGTKHFTVNSNQRLIHANCANIINPFEIHSDKNMDNEDCVIKMIYLNQDIINFFAKQLTGNIPKNSVFTNDLITNPLFNTAILTFFDDINETKLLDVKLKELVKILLSYTSPIDDNVIKNTNNYAINDSIEKARLNLFERIDIDKMSKECKMSKFQFIRYFKKQTGMTPASYILLQRIIKAKTLILNKMPIGEAALEVGFYDHAQFCKFFKYYTNTSPTEFKRNCNIIQG